MIQDPASAEAAKRDICMRSNRRFDLTFRNISRWEETSVAFGITRVFGVVCGFCHFVFCAVVMGRIEFGWI